MNRRNFFKVITGFVAGIFATSVKAKEPQLTAVMVQRFADDINPWEELGCKDCYVECKHFDVCRAKLKFGLEFAEKAANPHCWIRWSLCEKTNCFELVDCSDNININKNGSLTIS